MKQYADKIEPEWAERSQKTYWIRSTNIQFDYRAFLYFIQMPVFISQVWQSRETLFEVNISGTLALLNVLHKPDFVLIAKIIFF